MKRKNNSYTKQDDQYLKDNYPTLDRETIIATMNRSWASIKWRSQRLGLDRPNIRQAKLKKLLHNSVENAYWWGFIMADGYISYKGDLKITLSSIDEEHLRSLSEHLGFHIRICKQIDKKLSSIYVMDKINGVRLKEKLQIGKQKTYNPPQNCDFLQTERERLAFFIGFTDGDGNITHNRKGVFKSIRIVVHGNWYTWWTNFCRRLQKDWPELRFTVNNTNKRSNTTVYIGTKNTKNLLDIFIASHKLPILNRKWKLHTNSTIKTNNESESCLCSNG